MGKAAIGTSPPPAQRHSRQRYTQFWLKSNLADPKDSEKGNWWNDECNGSSSLKAGQEALSPVSTSSWLGMGSNSGWVRDVNPVGQDEGNWRTIEPLPTMLASESTNAKLPSPVPQSNGKHVEAEKALPPCRPQFERTVSEAPILNSSPNAQHSPPKPLRPSISGSQSFQRLKKRVPWRGKACIIALPRDDGKTSSAKAIYLRPEDVSERLRRWESQGYDIRGFKLSTDSPDSIANGSDGQSRRIHPDPEDIQQERRNHTYRVSIPDRHGWEAYVNQVNEEKLRALGVSFVDEDPSTSTTPALQRASRNVSSPKFAVIMSPSIAYATAPNTELYREQYAQQPRGPSMPNSRVASGASQGYSNHAKPSVAHFPRCSIVMPNGGVPPSHSLFRPTLPPLGTWSPSQQYDSQPATRAVSPVMNGQFQKLGAALSPVSTTSHANRILAASQDSRHLFALMQQEQARLQAQQLRQQQQQQQMLFRSSGQTEVNQHRFGDELYPTRYNSQPEIASPIPRGHRQNLSETLQKEIEDVKSSLGDCSNGKIDEDDTVSKEKYGGKMSDGEPPDQLQRDGIHSQSKGAEIETNPSPAKSPITEEECLANARPGHASESSINKLDATAPVFEIRSRTLSGPDIFAFQGEHRGPPAPPINGTVDIFPSTTKAIVSTEHSGLNVAAPAFVPINLQKRSAPSREFSFSSSGPAFKLDAPDFKPSGSGLAASEEEMNLQAPNRSAKNIFGNIDFSEIIRPTKKSKAIPIVKPSESEQDSDEDADGQEDESGRITQPEGRQKRIRRYDNDGDQVPLFATPSSPIPQGPEKDTSSRSISPLSPETSGKDDITPLESATHQLKEIIDDFPASEVSSLTEDPASAGARDDIWVPFSFASAQEAADFNVALPLQPTLEKPLQDAAAKSSHATIEAIRDFPTNLMVQGSTINGLAEIEGQGDVANSICSTSSSKSTRASSPSSSRARQRHAVADVRDFGADPLINGVTYIEPSYNEIDAVMKHLNDEDSDLGVERNAGPWRSGGSEPSSVPPTQVSSGSHLFLPATHLRSDAPSPSPNRLREPYQYLPPTESESADTVDKELVARNARFSPSYRPSRSDVCRLNSPGSRSISDWDDAISSSEEQKLRTRSSFFDDRVNGIVEDIIQRHLGPLEKNLATIIKDNIAALSGRSSSRRPRRTLSEEAEQSDADDEDDEGATSQTRLKSPLRDRSYEKLKASIQDICAAQQQLAQPSQLTEDINTVNELKASLQQAPKSSSDLKTIVEEAVGRQLRGRSGPITSSHQSATAEKSQLHIDGLESMLKVAETRAEDELKARRATEDALADTQRLLRGALNEAAEQRESAEETERSLANFHDERHETLRHTAMLEGIRESLEKNAAELSEKNAALEDTLKEYRLSSTQWRQEIEDAKAENSGLTRTINTLKAEIEESMKGRETLRDRFERLQEDMTTITTDIARDQSIWRNREEDHIARADLLTARLEAEARTRERLVVEVNRLEVQEKEALKAQFMVDQTRKANVELERLVGQLKSENYEHQQVAARFEREFHDARESAKAEVQRTRTAMEADIEAARTQVTIMRADLESVVSRLQSQVDDATADAADAKARYELMLQEASDSRQLALRQAAEARDAAFQEHYRFHERAVGELRSQHERALSNALEDKARFENHLNERLALADEKVAHYTDRVAHLEERLQIAKSAAHAAVQAVQSQKASSAPPASRASLPFAKGTNVPDKISPQALRESIMVLQEQLQARESRIERLEEELSQVDTDAPEKVKNQDMEITWLRELLGVRIDDLQDIISTLSQPRYDRESVRDAVIRLKANLQMEQQEKERAMAGGQTFPSLASISNLAASPRALPLAAAAAWGNWRKARETPFSSLSGIANDSLEQTPSRSSPSDQSFLSGLMTPPNTNMRQTPPTQQNANSSRPTSSRRPLRPYSTPRQSFMLQEDKRPSKPLGPPATPPLMRRTSYDQDAQSADVTEDDAPAVHRQASSEHEPFGPCIDSVGNTA